jgi:C4-dicarboxylate transporter
MDEVGEVDRAQSTAPNKVKQFELIISLILSCVSVSIISFRILHFHGRKYKEEEEERVEQRELSLL